MVLLKRIEGFTDYWISLEGEVWSDRLNRFLKQSIKSNGYLRVDLYKDKKQTTKYIHRLLAESFIEKIEGKKIIDHVDQNKTNNSLSNLRWTTVRGNSQNMKN